MIYTKDEETIIARCTPEGSGAIALLRISGANALGTVDRMSNLSSKKSILKVPTHTIHYGYIIDKDGSHIDQVLFLVMHGPKTFTGENTVEITCHNNPFIIDAIIERALECGARLAQNGEFTQRAFLNKKIDLIQAESINDLISAHTQGSLKASLSQMEGTLSYWINTIEKTVLKTIALCEASFEFIDDEITFDKEIRDHIASIRNKIETIKKSYSRQNNIKDGIRIALIGSTNTGKSSLFNVLLNKNRSIVTKHAGTTRDTVEAGLYQYGTYITLVDTAGLRETHDEIESKGIERSQKESFQADLVIVVVDASLPLEKEEKNIYEKILQKHEHKCLIVHNKIDISQHSISWKNHTYISVSCKSRTGINVLEQKLKHMIKGLVSSNNSTFILNQRQHSLLDSFDSHIKKIEKSLPKKVEHELLSYELKEALERLAALSGKTITKQQLDLIFKSFCIGK